MWFIILIAILVLCGVLFSFKNKNSNVNKLIDEAMSVLDSFFGLVLTSPDNLRGELDADFINKIMMMCKSRLNSSEYKRYYAVVVEKYGSVEKQVYDWLGGALATMYTTKEDLTEIETKTLDCMLTLVNIELKKLGAQTFFTKDNPMGTNVYPD